MDTIIDFLDQYNETLTEKIVALPEYNVTALLSCDYFVNSLECREYLGLNIYSHIEYKFKSTDKICIILPTFLVDEEYVFKRINQYLKQKISVINFYKLTGDNLEALASESTKNGVRFENHAQKSFPAINKFPENKTDDIPMIYISGINAECEQFTTHLMLNNICAQRGIKVINITNYGEGALFGFADLSKVLDISEIWNSRNFSIINQKISQLIGDDDIDIIIISDSEPLMQIEPIVEKDSLFGYNHFLLKNSVGCDYYIYNIPINLMRIIDMRSLINDINRQTNSTPIAFGLTHNVIYKTNDDEFIFVMADDDEYNALYKAIKLENEIFDTQNKETVLNNLNIW